MADDKRLINFFQEKPYLITLALAGVLVLVVGLAIVGIGLGRGGGAEIEIREAEPQASESAGTIYVDVGGAVMRPGLYQLKSDSRVNDALVAGGGLAKDADRDWISQNLNLAAKLTDGIKVYLPFRDSNKDSPSQSKGLSLNINTASLAELDQLWGVGPATAQKIIDNRPYAKVEDLLDKKAVKANVYEAIKDKITVL
ncbi:ComEA family DNA-binding protein [Patescibacteria group bacterium]|nr:ComEA family DNA-binding protein [Patescibacteria group bacterium]